MSNCSDYVEVFAVFNDNGMGSPNLMSTVILRRVGVYFVGVMLGNK
jgi:hypothetical protein